MALSGTISDFGLGDIFQLIGIQRKTGTLTLENETDAVIVMFHEGQIVGADTRTESVEDLLGAVLVRTSLITEDQLKQALSLQKKTLQRLGYILVRRRYILEDELVEALRVQSLQIVYRLFRWRVGKYNFVATDDLDYDQKHFVPISAETILMEGARMIDEWPLIERRIRSDSMVVRRTEFSEVLDLSPQTAPVDEDLEFDFVFDKQATDEQATSETEAGTAEPEIAISDEERRILVLVDGQRSVMEINDHSNMGQFDTYRLLADLMTRKLIEEVKRPNAAEVQRTERRFPEKLFHLLIGMTLTLFALAAASTLPTNHWTPWQLGLQDAATERLQRLASRQRLERIDTGLRIFYLDRGSYPLQLADLSEGGYLLDADLSDPWGRRYVYQRFSAGYRIDGFDAAGEADPDFTVRRRFSAVERMMHSPESP